MPGRRRTWLALALDATARTRASLECGSAAAWAAARFASAVAGEGGDPSNSNLASVYCVVDRDVLASCVYRERKQCDAPLRE